MESASDFFKFKLQFYSVGPSVLLRKQFSSIGVTGVLGMGLLWGCLVQLLGRFLSSVLRITIY